MFLLKRKNKKQKLSSSYYKGEKKKTNYKIKNKKFFINDSGERT